MIPNNEEHVEARQENVNYFREQFLEKHPEERAKHQAVEKAIEVLNKEEVPFLLFTKLNAPEGDTSGFWQWQNTKLLYPFLNGRVNPLVKEFNEKVILAMINYIIKTYLENISEEQMRLGLGANLEGLYHYCLKQQSGK